jgi:hypothetical protein
MFTTIFIIDLAFDEKKLSRAEEGLYQRNNDAGVGSVES